MEGVELLDDRVLIRRIEPRSALMLTDRPKSIKGLVLAVGPGKWVPGTWWYRGQWYRILDGHVDGKPVSCDSSWQKVGKWEWADGYREPMGVKPGDTVLFNSRWNDLAHAENKGTGADLKGPLERPLSYKLDPLTHLIREADIFCICAPETRAEYIGTAIETQYFKNTTTAEECFTTRVGPR